MQGAKQEDDGTKVTMKTDYVDVPIMANVYLYKGLPSRPASSLASMSLTSTRCHREDKV